MAKHQPTGYPTRDWTNRKGAEMLIRKLDTYWKARGTTANFWLVPFGQVDQKTGEHMQFGVRSDLNKRL